MCGIFGIWRYDDGSIDQAIVRGAVDRLRHRGPDDEGYLLFSVKARKAVHCGGADTDPSLNLQPIGALSGEAFDLAFGFRRLSILDLSSAGHQPMSTLDGRYSIVLNGEIYNYLELRAELEDLGYTFRSQSDTEVLLVAYAHWGPKALNRLLGMFAFAVLDRRERSLFLARDFFGIKPLYYTDWRYGGAFGSEIKTLLDLPGVSRRVNPLRLYEYLRSGLTDYGGETLFADIYQLPAAHYLEIPLSHPNGPRPVRYWQVDLNQRQTLSFDEAADRIQHLFLENVKLHLRSDVPVGTSFSGGIDSSSILTAMRRLQGQDLNLSTFSYIADQAALNEEAWVDLMTKATGATPFKVRPEPQDLVNDLDELVYLQDEPFGSTSIYAQHRVFRLAQDVGVKVMLDGQGADEFLGGYPVYAGARLASLVRQGKWLKALSFYRQASRLPWTQGRRLLLWAAGFLLPRAIQNPLRRLVGKEVIPAWLSNAWLMKQGVQPRPIPMASNGDVLRNHLYHTFVETSLPMLLRYEDRNSMAYSIESRVPFLTPDLVNFVFALPEEYIIAPDGTSKAVFRKAMRGIVPDPILDRKDKIGFGTPEKNWLAALRPWVEATLGSETATRIPVLNLGAAQQDWQAIIKGRTVFDFRIWRWVNLIRWVELFQVSFEN